MCTDDKSGIATSNSGAAAAAEAEPSSSASATAIADFKRRKRLELNRKAAKESRERKKRRVESLNHNIVLLTRDNYELRSQNEGLRHILVSQSPRSVQSKALLRSFSSSTVLLHRAQSQLS
jgi:bZIP transcription factor